MNIKNILKLIDILNEYNIINITLNMIYYNELNIFDENELKELKEFIKENNIDENDLYYEFVINDYNKYDDDTINKFINNFILKEFENIELYEYYLIDYFYDDINKFHQYIIEINIDDDEINDIIKNIRKYNK